MIPLFQPLQQRLHFKTLCILILVVLHSIQPSQKQVPTFHKWAIQISKSLMSQWKSAWRSWNYANTYKISCLQSEDLQLEEIFIFTCIFVYMIEHT